MDKPTHILSVDPGVKGAICLLCVATRWIRVFDTPVIEGQVDGIKFAAIVDMLKFEIDPGVIYGVVELVSGMPRQTGSFNFGRSAGVIHGVLNALGVPYSLISAAQWKPALGLRRLTNETQGQNKMKARELAMKIFSNHTAEFKRVRDDGRAEAALLSFFYARKRGWMV